MSILEDYKQARQHKEGEKKRARVILIHFIYVKFSLLAAFRGMKERKLSFGCSLLNKYGGGEIRKVFYVYIVSTFE